MINSLREGPSLLPGLALSGLSVGEMWLAYWALGGNETLPALATYLTGESAWSVQEHTVAAHALDEACRSRGFGHPGRRPGTAAHRPSWPDDPGYPWH